MEICFETIVEFCKKNWHKLIIVILFLLIWSRLAKIDEIYSRVRDMEAHVQGLNSSMEELNRSIGELYVNMPVR